MSGNIAVRSPIGAGDKISALRPTDDGIEYHPKRESLTIAGAGGKPRPYDPEEAAVVLELYASGLPYKTVFGTDTVAMWFYRWLNEHPELEEAWALATARRAQRFGEEVVEIADAAEQNGTDPAYAKIRIATRQWFAERLAPGMFANRSTVSHNVTADPEIAKRLEKYHRLRGGLSERPPIIDAVFTEANPDVALIPPDPDDPDEP